MIKNKFYVYGEDVTVPSHMNFGKDMLDKMMQHKHIVALINADTDEKLTYGELAQKVVNVALSLTRMGVRKGDVISICSEKRFDVMVSILGIICAGATYSPTDISYEAVPLLHRAKIAQPKLMFISPTFFNIHKEKFDTVECIEKYIVYDMLDDDSIPKPQVEQEGGIWYKDFLTETANVEDFLPMPVEGWKDYAFILFSSGTTGLPKGVPLTHLSFIINSMSLANESFKGARLLNSREWYYTYGLLYTLGCMKQGTTIVYSYRNTHADCLAAIQKYKIKYLQLTPVSVIELIKSPILEDYDTSSVQAIISSSTTLMAEQVLAVKKRLVNLKHVYQLYGSVEAGCACNELIAPLGPRHGSTGTLCHDFIAKVVDLISRQPVGPGERGEICLKSACVTPGYLGITNRDYMDEEGFYKTGDFGYYDKDNYFYVVDRLKELIKYNDFSVAPAELESIFEQHSSVREAGVVCAPHVTYGQAPTAFVVLQPGSRSTEDELVRFVETKFRLCIRLAGGVRFVDQLPRGTMQKLDRNALRNML